MVTFHRVAAQLFVELLRISGFRAAGGVLDVVGDHPDNLDAVLHRAVEGFVQHGAVAERQLLNILKTLNRLRLLAERVDANVALRSQGFEQCVTQLADDVIPIVGLHAAGSVDEHSGLRARPRGHGNQREY